MRDASRQVTDELLALDPASELRRVREAYVRVERAYAVARRLVFDVFPPGGDQAAELGAEQRAALEALHEAEEELELARRAMHRSAPVEAGRVDAGAAKRRGRS